MICKHCEIESSKDEGVEVVRNEPITNENGLIGQLTEKRLYLSRLVSFTFFSPHYSSSLVVCLHGFVLLSQMFSILLKKQAISIHIQ